MITKGRMRLWSSSMPHCRWLTSLACQLCTFQRLGTRITITYRCTADAQPAQVGLPEDPSKDLAM